MAMLVLFSLWLQSSCSDILSVWAWRLFPNMAIQHMHMITKVLAGFYSCRARLVVRRVHRWNVSLFL
eukprot:2745521-Pleurochrysis_carterae.AAC.1